MKRLRRTSFVLLVAAMFAPFGTIAWADLDPPSDVLLLQDVYLPYNPKVCSQIAGPLRKVTKEAKKAGYPVKVAVVSSKADLGGAPQFLGKPQPYAQFLGSEIGIYKGPGLVGPDDRSVLTVMSSGFGYDRALKAADVSAVARALPRPSGSHPNDLARAAIGAVQKLAKAARHPVPVPKIRSGCSGGGGGSSAVLIFAAPLGLLLIAAAALGLTRRRAGGQKAA